MNSQAWSTVVFSILRHLLSMVGGAIVAKDHEGDLMTLAGALVAIAPVIISSINSHRIKSKADELEKQLSEVKRSAITTAGHQAS